MIGSDEAAMQLWAAAMAQYADDCRGAIHPPRKATCEDLEAFDDALEDLTGDREQLAYLCGWLGLDAAFVGDRLVHHLNAHGREPIPTRELLARGGQSASAPPKKVQTQPQKMPTAEQLEQRYHVADGKLYKRGSGKLIRSDRTVFKGSTLAVKRVIEALSAVAA